ncbi:MAG: hypothetical protein WBQ03_25790 [Candidatus Sulfotelmatobacter sp.]
MSAGATNCLLIPTLSFISGDHLNLAACSSVNGPCGILHPFHDCVLVAGSVEMLLEDFDSVLMPLVLAQWKPTVYLNQPSMLAPFGSKKVVILMGKQLLVIVSRSSPLHQAIGATVVVRPSVGGSARDFDSILNPSTEALILIAKVVSAALCSKETLIKCCLSTASGDRVEPV